MADTFNRTSALRASLRLIAVSLLLLLALAGCTTKSKAKAQAQAAFIAGQQQALATMQQASGPHITVVGPVRNAIIPWDPDLTLAKALVAAEYFGQKDPRLMVINRQGQRTTVDAKHLLGGQDVPLESGDVVEIRP